MLTHILLENFKCFESLELEPRRITVLIGPNGAGKSSVLQALMFLRQSLGHEDPQWQGRFVNLVSFQQALRTGATESNLAIELVGARGIDGLGGNYVYRAAFSEAGLLSNVGRVGEVAGGASGKYWLRHPLGAQWHRGESQDETRESFDDYRGRFEYEATGSPVIGKPHKNVRVTVAGPPGGQEDAVQHQQKRYHPRIYTVLAVWPFSSRIPPARLRACSECPRRNPSGRFIR